MLTLLSGDAVNGGDGLSGSAIERDPGGDHTESDPCGGEETVNRGRVDRDRWRRARLHSIAKTVRQVRITILTDEPQHSTCGEIDAEGLFA